ncbi:MAG TPA: MBL fold metallo-hydrolase [Pyrinomonadaceae bacterium]|jgi:glyoxylase-like metal-dependent hydrolase (beta-lactamase superfamily II)/8-oxo-dGTP pyrophosphatase MutT (NUDIX family)|nr:MBL fold metallo-hydrolase [Pyrinomonadaceae bacterium]
MSTSTSNIVRDGTNAAAAATPKDAAAVILLREAEGGEAEVYWVRRSEKLAFLGGFHAFPGGQREASDASTRVSNCEDALRGAMISCAARELFEEVGVLVARGAHALTVGQRASLLNDLASARMSFPELLDHYGLHLDASDWTFAGRWVTPPFSPRRFDTWFFLVQCPPKQQPAPAPDGELDQGEWTLARDAYARWRRSEVLTAPPVLHALKTLADGLTEDLTERLLSIPQAHGEPVRRIEFRPGFICYPVRTPTKPPATHTNCYIVGSDEIVIIDPASPYEEEQAALAGCVDELLAEGRALREIILTHLHPDHMGGINALVEHLGGGVKVATHRLTAEALRGVVEVNRLIEDGEIIELGGEPALSLRAMHTPGHARGHLCFYEERTGALITGDNIVGLGSVLIDPPEGNMRDYLSSLERLRALPILTVLFGAHGPAMGHPRAKIEEYISHRLAREASILAALREGARNPAEIVARVYTDVHPKAHAMAQRAVIAHLEKLLADGLVTRLDDDHYAAQEKG